MTPPLSRAERSAILAYFARDRRLLRPWLAVDDYDGGHHYLDEAGEIDLILASHGYGPGLIVAAMPLLNLLDRLALEDPPEVTS
jgi:hypothetical protein